MARGGNGQAVQGEPHSPPPAIADHHLLRRIGKGSYGEVWLARNALGAFRAIKVVYRGSFDSDRPFEREFEGIRKFEPISRKHPSQLDILQVGRREDFFYYVMELADDANAPKGAPIDPDGYEPLTLKTRVKATGSLPFHECVQIGRALVEALEHLHAEGLIHRDIKPANIVFVNGVPRLADIGLVTDANATRTLVGTEGFIPSEGGNTPGADLYALGKVLYEISTGLDRSEFPAVDAGFGKRTDRESLLELLEIVMKACAPQVKERYANAAEMRSDLNALAAGKSVRRRQQWLRARRVAWKAAGWATGAALLVGGLLWWTSQRPKAEPLTSNPEALRAYQLGVFHGQKRTASGFSNAVRELQRAIALDPQFVAAHAALAEVSVTRARVSTEPPGPYWDEAHAAAETASRMAPGNYGALVALASYERDYRRDLARAEKLCREAIRAAPAEANAYYVLSHVLAYQERHEEAIRNARAAAERDPVSALLAANVASRLVIARRYTEAETEYRHAIALQPNFHLPYDELGFLLLHLGRDGEALEVLRKSWQMHDTPANAVKESEAAWRQAGAHGYIENLYSRQAAALAEGRAHNPDSMAKYLIHLGRIDEAMTMAEQALKEHRSMFYLVVHPFYDEFKKHPRYAELVKRVRTPSR